MVPAGDITTAVIEGLANTLEAGDIVIDGGNSYYRDDLSTQSCWARRGFTAWTAVPVAACGAASAAIA